MVATRKRKQSGSSGDPYRPYGMDVVWIILRRNVSGEKWKRATELFVLHALWVVALFKFAKLLFTVCTIVWMPENAGGKH